MSGLARVVAPSLDPISLSEAKAQCRVAISDDDGLIAGFVLAARQHVEKVTGRALITQRWSYSIDRCWPVAWDGGCYRTRIVLPLPPLQSVVSVQYVDPNGDTQTLAADQYRVVKGRIFGHIEPAYGVIWPPVRPQSDAVTVLFETGYGSTPGDVPEPIRQAMLLHIEMLYDRDPGSRETLERARDSFLIDYMTSF